MSRRVRMAIAATGTALLGVVAAGPLAAGAANAPAGHLVQVPGGKRLAGAHVATSTAAPRTASQAVTPDTTVPSQLILDPGFEGGPNNNPNWNQFSSGGFQTITNTDPHTGSYSADVCGYVNCNPDQVTQSIFIPHNTVSGTLSFWVAAGCPPGNNCSHLNNGVAIGLLDAQGQSVETDYGLDSNPNALYSYGSGSLSSVAFTQFLQQHAGQTVTLVVLGQTQNGDDAEFFVDDMALNINAVADPPVNVTATATGPTQAQVSWTAPGYQGTGAVTGYTVSTYDHLRNFVSSTTVSSSPAMITGLTTGTPYYFTVTANNSAGSSAPATSFSVTTEPGTTPPAQMAASSTQQYTLPNSDGVTWQSMDPANLSLSITPSSDEDVLLSGNADLWTWNAGYNQDIGILVTPSNASGSIAAWKESGGFAGTFSPNAAFVETVYHMTAGVTYSVELQWKTNKPAMNGSVSAGAGPINSAFSPTRLVARVLPAAPDFSSVSSTQQYSLSNSNGSTWQVLDGTNLATTLSPTADGNVLLSGNADMWTWNAGYNQDLGIQVSEDGGTPQVIAWKESGGFAGTFSPNAAYVQTVLPVQGGHSYSVQLVWKTNRNAPGAKISVGAGPINSAFSPTRLTAFTLPTDTTTWSSAASTQQYTLSNSDGSTWAQMDGTNLSTTLTPTADEDTLVSANADLWTANAGYNQDVAVFVTDNGGTPEMLMWKESGGFGGTFSPNAAFGQTTFHMTSGHTYVFSLWWKTNKSASGATIYAGAGPISGQFSPTRLTVIPAS